MFFDVLNISLFCSHSSFYVLQFAFAHCCSRLSDSSSSAEPISIKSEQEGTPSSPQLSSSAEENEQQGTVLIILFFCFLSILKFLQLLISWTLLLSFMNSDVHSDASDVS